MKKIIILFFIVIGNFSNAQVKYHFDYTLLYDNNLKMDELQTNLYFINSNDNSYLMHVHHNNDSIKLYSHFIDYKGFMVNSKINKNEFYKAETLNFECESVYPFLNQYKYKSKKYAINKWNDTLINDTLYYHYSIKSTKSLKYQKRKKINEVHIIIDQNEKLIKIPLFYPLLYNLEMGKNIFPKGIIKMIYSIDLQGKIVFKQELKEIFKIDKYLTFPNECRDSKSLKLFSQ